MADELEYPPGDEQRRRPYPLFRLPDNPGNSRQRNHNHGDTQRVAELVHGVLMTLRILRDPLVPGSVAHVGDVITEVMLWT